MSMIIAERVSKWYGEVMGLNDFSAKIQPGITGLVGPNGAGKTTLIKMLMGLMRPSKGQVYVMGQDPWANPGLMEKVGYCVEHDNFYKWMTGRQFVTLLTQLHGFEMEEAEDRAVRALGTMRLQESMDRRIEGYSKGMKQRLKISQAIAHDPNLIILDEPLSGTDPVGRYQIIRLIKRWSGEGKSVLVSSHVLYEIEKMTESILLIARGKMVADGNIHEIRGLIDQHPHTIVIKSPQARELGKAMANMEFIQGMSFSEGKVSFRTRSPDLFYKQLTEMAAKQGYRILEMHSPDDNLQAVFNYLVG